LIASVLATTLEVVAVCDTVRLEVTVTFELKVAKPRIVALLAAVRLAAVRLPDVATLPPTVRPAPKVVAPPIMRLLMT
jgi:hypothetical protein